MKIYYFDEETKKFAGMDIISDDADIPQNATTVEVDSSLLSPYFDPDTQAWKGLSEEEYDKQNPSRPPQGWSASDQDKKDAQTTLMIANLTQQVQAQQKLNAQLVLQVADLTKKVEAK